MAARILISGVSGFVGRTLVSQAVRRGLLLRGMVRKIVPLPEEIEQIIGGEIDATTDWSAALRDVSVVIHLAARVHVMRDTSADSLAEFRKVNVLGTENLARQAARAGVKRLVYVSSIKVNGEETADGRCYAEQDAPAPRDPYGISKWEAEQALWRVARETGLEVVVVRPPLVYGACVKGNFAQMLKVLVKDIPLPLASVQNLRSLVYVENLVDALIICATHPAAAGQTYLVSDGEDISTPDLLRRLGAVMGHHARLFPVPIWMLKLGGMLLGRSERVERLVGSLRIGSSRIHRELGWQPPYTLEEGLRITATSFMTNYFKDSEKS